VPPPKPCSRPRYRTGLTAALWGGGFAVPWPHRRCSQDERRHPRAKRSRWRDKYRHGNQDQPHETNTPRETVAIASPLVQLSTPSLRPVRIARPWHPTCRDSIKRSPPTPIKGLPPAQNPSHGARLARPGHVRQVRGRFCHIRRTANAHANKQYGDTNDTIPRKLCRRNQFPDPTPDNL